MELVHRRIYELEQQQLQIKAKYVQRTSFYAIRPRTSPDNDVGMMKRLRDCVMSWNPVVEASLTSVGRLTLLLNHLHQVSATVEVAYLGVSLQVGPPKVDRDSLLLLKNHRRTRIYHLIWLKVDHLG